LYDLANQFFVLNIVSLYFPRWLILKEGYPEIFYSISFSISMLLVAVSSPVLGVISDIQDKHKRFLAYFTSLSIIFTILLSLNIGAIVNAIFFIIANFACQEAIIFYNSLLTKIASLHNWGLISGIGRMFGYTGAMISLFTTKYIFSLFGYEGVFLFTGLLFFIFALPCLLFIKENGLKSSSTRYTPVFRVIIYKLKYFFCNNEEWREFKAFSIAMFLGLCVVNTVILFMSVYATKVFGLDEHKIINLIIFSTFFAIGGSLVSGVISDIIGYRKCLEGVFVLWGVVVLLAGLGYPPLHWAIGALTGVGLGAVWVVSRALVINMIPSDKIGEAFGILNLVGYLSGIGGSLFWGLILWGLSSWGVWSYRISCLSLILFIIGGIIKLSKLKCR